MIFNALRQDEVVTANLGGRLKLAIDTAVSLFDATWIPREIEMEEVGAMSLEIQAFPRGIGRQQDAERILCRIGVEALLNFFAACSTREAVDDLDALVGAVSALDRLFENRFQMPLGPLAILGEDEHATVVPLRGRPI